MDFLHHLLNNPTFTTIITLGLGYFFHRSSSDRRESLVDTFEAFARQAVQQLAGQPDAAPRAAKYIEDYVVEHFATKFGVQPTQVTKYEPLYHPIVEHAVADALEEIQRRAGVERQMQANLDLLRARTQAVADEFKHPAGITEQKP